MTLNEAIVHSKEVATSKCDECGKEHQQLAEWLAELVVSREKITRLETELKADHQQAIDTANELAAYKDKTPITDEFLIRNGFEKRTFDFLYCDDVVEIVAQNIDREAGIWRIEISYLDDGYPQTLDICTVGQMRMFLAIEGLENIAKQMNTDIKQSENEQKPNWSEENEKFECPNINVNDTVEVSSRMKYIDDDLKPIAEFILDYANWDLHKDEWNQPTLTVPLFRVLDALVQRGKPYCCS